MSANTLDLVDYAADRVDETVRDYHVVAKVAKPAKACPECAACRLEDASFRVYEKAKGTTDALHRSSAWQRPLGHDIHGHFADLIRAWSNWRPYFISHVRPLRTNMG